MSVPVFPYSNIVYFQFCSYSFNDSFVRHFIFLMRFWSFPNFHMKLLLLINTFKGRSGPFRYFHTPTSALLNSVLCSFTDSFVHHFIFLMRFWSFPYFHMKLLLLIKTMKGRFRSVPVFPYSNIVYFQFCSYSFNDPFVRHFIVLMRFWSFPNFHMNFLLLIKTFKGRSGPFRYFHTPTSDVFNPCSFLRPIFHISDKVFGLFPIFSYRFLFL